MNYPLNLENLATPTRPAAAQIRRYHHPRHPVLALVAASRPPASRPPGVAVSRPQASRHHDLPSRLQIDASRPGLPSLGRRERITASRPQADIFPASRPVALPCAAQSRPASSRCADRRLFRASPGRRLFGVAVPSPTAPRHPTSPAQASSRQEPGAELFPTEQEAPRSWKRFDFFFNRRTKEFMYVYYIGTGFLKDKWNLVCC